MCLLKFFGRLLRPGIQNSPRRPMAGGTTNPIQLPNAPQALSDPCMDTVCPLFLAFMIGWMINALFFVQQDPLLFIVGDKSNQKVSF